MQQTAEHTNRLEGMHQIIEELMQKRSFWVAVRAVGIILSPLMAAVVTFFLFYFMQSLIAGGERLDQRVTVVKIVDATMPEIELLVIEEIDKPEPIENVVEEQPELADKRVNLDSGPSLNIDRAIVEVDLGLDIVNTSIATTDGDFLPLVAMAAQYPSSASARGIEGWCLVSFTVDSLGNVVEDCIVVLDAEPVDIFNRNSIRAATRLKFQPRVQNGAPVDVPGVQYLFRFQLAD